VAEISGREPVSELVKRALSCFMMSIINNVESTTRDRGGNLKDVLFG